MNKSLISRFINQRTVVIIITMLFVAWFLDLRYNPVKQEGSDNAQSIEQVLMKMAVDCDVTQSACTSTATDAVLSLELLNRPSALTAFPAEVKTGLGLLKADKLTIAFSMKGMDMGLRPQILKKQSPGIWSGDVILPICSSGRRDWSARVEVLSGGNVFVAQYSFVLGQ